MKNILKQIFLKIAKSFLIWGLNRIYNYVDTDNDGLISKEELAIVFEKVKQLRKKL